MNRDIVQYLNRGDDPPMRHRLLDLLSQSSQVKAPAQQWIAWLKGLSQKGVKARELEESELIAKLEGEEAKKVFTRDELVESAKSALVTIKEVQLASPYFNAHRHKGGEYSEWLYVANSERDNVIDRIDDIRWQIEDLNFHMERLIAEPEVLDTLEKQLKHFLSIKDKCADFLHHHFTAAMKAGHGKNLIAHVRRTLRLDQGVYFLEEIQSDWAQRYRADMRVPKGIPTGPYITATEDWSGLVLRRHLALAARIPQVQRVAWITSRLRNGCNDAREDGLNDFYTKMLPKMAEKVIGKAGGKVVMTKVILGSREYEVPGFEMTPAVRQALLVGQPMYSRANVVRADVTPAQGDRLRADILARCQAMLGSVAKIRVVNRLYDVATGHEVAGRYTRGFVQCSLQAHSPRMAADHEVWHAAMDLMLSPDEVDLVRDRFAIGSRLNERVRLRLLAMGQSDAADQCRESADEAAAHAFALWRGGSFTLRPTGWLGKLFEHVRDTMQQTSNWLNSVWARSSGEPCNSVEQLFVHLSNGRLSQRAAERAHESNRAAFA